MAECNGYRHVPCKCAKEFFDKLWNYGLKRDNFEWFFRGQNADWPLRPKAMRIDFLRRFVVPIYRTIKPMLEQSTVHSLTADERLNLKIYIQRRVEDSIVRKFAISADVAGLFVPTDSTLELGGEYWRIKEEEALAASGGNYPKLREPTSVVDALAQHFGIPTRLLDWTYNPLVAAFFAAYSDTEVEQKLSQNPNTQMVIWAINPAAFFDRTQLQLVTQLRSRIRPLDIQDGVFLYDKRADTEFREAKRWVAIEEHFKMNEAGNGIYKFTVPFSQRGEMLNLLDVYGVNMHVLVPSFRDVAQDTAARFRSRPIALIAGWRR